MEDDSSLDNLPKGMLDSEMESEELPLLNDNSNGHLDSEFNSVDASAVDESSASNVFLNTVELSTGSVGDFNERNTEEFNAESFEVGDNAVTFPSDSMNNIFSDGDSRLSDTGYKHSDTDGDASQKININNDFELSNDNSMTVEDNSNAALITDNVENTNGSEDFIINDKEEIAEAMDTDQELAPVKQKIEQFEQTNIEEELEEPQESESVDAEKEDNVAVMDEKVAGQDDNVAEIAEEVAGQDDNVAEIAEEVAGQDDNVAEIAENVADKDENVAEKAENVADKDDNVAEIAENVTDKEDNVAGDDDAVKKKAELGGAEETEVVSEDELPCVEKPKIKDAENVSDDELPGPRPADMPADTEVVSEDELPASKKESRKRKPDATEDGYDPGSPTSETEAATKKQAVAKNGESKPISAEKRPSTDEKPKKKVLPELDKYWKVVNDDPSDFTGWTYLLQYVDQESDVEAAREAYDAFLSHYPYCYGYWRKYADYEKRKGSKKKCFEVLERGLKAIPLSVDLWIHYLNHIKTTKSDDHAFIKSQYERAIETCGLEFRSDRLWESYIKWEAENGTPLNVTAIYDRLLATPTLGYTSHFDNFQEHVMGEPVAGVISREELVRLRAAVRDGAAPVTDDLPPGEDEPPDHVASEEEAQAIKERVIAARRKVHKATGEEIAARWTFEEGIKRPYFHVKPLERCQLKNWKSYLEWEKTHGSLKRCLVLHERCLIACALYEEFWMRLVKFLEERSGEHSELIPVEREVLERACTVHHLDKYQLHLHWAHFEEAQGNAAKAAEILDRIEKTCPNVVQIQYRRVNLERRRGDYEKCCQLYESYISTAKNKAIASAHAIKYARFLYHVREDRAAARKVLDEAIVKEPLNQRLHLQRLDLALHTPGTPYEELEELVQSYEKQEGAELETSAAMACRRRELAEELGPAAAARAAQLHARALTKPLRKRARKDKQDVQPPAPAAEATKKKDGAASTSTTTAAGTNYYQTPPATAPAYDQSYQQQYQPPWGYQQPPGPYQHPPHWPPQYPNYY